MLIFDGDYPMGSAYLYNVDLTLPIAEVRATQPVGLAGEDVSETRELIASLPEMRRGRVFAALVKIRPVGDGGDRPLRRAAAGQSPGLPRHNGNWIRLFAESLPSD